LSGLFPEAALLMRIKDCVDRFLLRGIDERAGVNDEHVGFLRDGSDFHPVLQNAPEHDLGVDQVLRATQADHADFGLL
jgi:hypothetical protein